MEENSISWKNKKIKTNSSWAELADEDDLRHLSAIFACVCVFICYFLIFIFLDKIIPSKSLVRCCSFYTSKCSSHWLFWHSSHIFYCLSFVKLHHTLLIVYILMGKKTASNHLHPDCECQPWQIIDMAIF